MAVESLNINICNAIPARCCLYQLRGSYTNKNKFQDLTAYFRLRHILTLNHATCQAIYDIHRLKLHAKQKL